MESSVGTMESGYPLKQTGNTQKQSSAQQEHPIRHLRKSPMSKESKEGVRDKTDDIVEKRKLGKLGMKEQPLIGQVLSPAEPTRKRALAATANFLAIDRGDIVYCAKELTRQMATPKPADWEKVVRLGRHLKKKQTQSSIVVQVSRNAVPT